MRLNTQALVLADNIISIQTSNGLEPTGNGLRLIVDDANQSASNLQLALFLREAFILCETLLYGPHESIETMSKALRLGNGSISARTRLTFLSPNLIKKS